MLFTTLLKDLRYGVRLLRNSPGFTAVAVLTMAIGIAANTTVFTWVDTVLFQPRGGIADGRTLVTLECVDPDHEGLNISYPDYLDFRKHLKLSTPAVSLLPQAFRVGEGENWKLVWGELVTDNYFAVLGVKPLLGRLPAADELSDQLKPVPVAVISERLWRSRFLADPAVIGRTVRVNRTTLTIVGVTPAAFNGFMRGLAFDMWVPLGMGQELSIVRESMLSNRKIRPFNAVARLKPGVPIETAREELATLARQLATAYPDTNKDFGATLLSEWEAHNNLQAWLKAPLTILLAMCFLVLLIACVNVANLLLARSITRQKEISIRLALGAARGRLVRQLLTEATLLPALGVVAAIPLTAWVQTSIAQLMPRMGNLPLRLDTQISGKVMAFAVLVTVAAGFFAGLSPALHAMRTDVNESLREVGRGGTSSRQSLRIRSLFVVSEVALAFVALVGAGLFVTSFRSVSAINPGFDARNVVIAQIPFSTNGYTDEQRSDFCERLRAGLEASPGILAVSYADTIPLGFGSGGESDVEVEGYVPAQNELMTVGRSRVAPGYFGLMHIPLLAGRDFSKRDILDGKPAIIVNESFARRFYGAQNPIGRRVRIGGDWNEIVGLVRDTKCYRLDEEPRPYFFEPLRRDAVPAGINVYLRTGLDLGQAGALVRRKVAAIDPDIYSQTILLSDYIMGPLFPQKIAAVMLTALSLIGLILSAVGLYSMMAYAVGERTHELGIRVALGAGSPRVLAMVIRKAMLMAGAGVLAGWVAAYASASLIGGLLIGVSATEPRVFLGAALFLVLIALLAASLPAYRATRVNPMITLRHE
ncbi:MAG: ABC transporter permease [Acidobacteriota bacterium]|jgi:predicted permease